MNGTHLSWRKVLMVVLVFVMFMGALFAYVFTAFPSNNEPVASRRFAIGSGVAAALAAVWFARLLADAVRDRRPCPGQGGRPLPPLVWRHRGGARHRGQNPQQRRRRLKRHLDPLLRPDRLVPIHLFIG